MSDINIPLFEPDLTDQDKKAVQDVLESGWITMGPRVADFEERFANFVGAKHAVAVNSCTAALHLAQALTDIGPGDEVVVPSLTFAATANTVAQTREPHQFLPMLKAWMIGLSTQQMLPAKSPTVQRQWFQCIMLDMRVKWLSALRYT